MGDVTARYLEMVRAELTKESNGKKVTNYRLAKELKTTEASISRYINKDMECEDDKIIFAIAQIAQVSPFEIIGKIHAKKAANPTIKQAWTALLNSDVVKNTSEHCILC